MNYVNTCSMPNANPCLQVIKIHLTAGEGVLQPGLKRKCDEL